MKKKLAKYLADYIEHERAGSFDDEDDLIEWLEQGIDAFESVEGVDIRFYHGTTTTHHAYYED